MRFGVVTLANSGLLSFESTGNVRAGVSAGTGQPLNLTGGTGTSGAGGNVVITGGTPAASQTAGAVSVLGANAVTAGQGGAVALTAGTSLGTNIGASVTLTAQPGIGSNQAGGNVALNPGAATGTGTQGSVLITPSSGSAIMRAGSLDLHVGGAPAATASNGLVAVQRTPTTITTTGQTLTNGSFARISTSGGALATVNLANPNVSAGQSVRIVKTSTDTNTFTLKSPAGNINGTLGTTGVAFGSSPESLSWIATSDGTDWWVAQSARSAAGTSSSAVLYWGNNSVSTTTTTRYLSPGFDQTTAQTAVLSFRVPRAGTMQNMYVLHNAGGGNGQPIVYTLRKNAAATPLTVSIPSTSTTAQDTTHTVSVVAGDQIDIEVTKAASIGASITDVTVTVEFAA